MSRPRFLADHDLNEHIIDGVLRREPVLDFIRARDVGLGNRSDPEVLAYAAEHGFLLVSHDVNTMVGHAFGRIAAGQDMSGLLMVQQSEPIGPVIDALCSSGLQARQRSGPVKFNSCHSEGRK